MIVKRTERGWPGHFICANSCLFRRNTLLEKGDVRIVVSTVGAYRCGEKIESIGLGDEIKNRYYETMAFYAKWEDPYWETDVSAPVYFDSPWAISARTPKELPKNVDNMADQMHEAVVAEISKKMNGIAVAKKKRKKE
jgi:hypothetical protein